MTLFEMSGVQKSFFGVPALIDARLTVHRGEVHALVGENGAGKSTLVKIMAGALEPDAGEMTLAGQPYRPRSPQEAMRRGFRLIYQEFNLVPEMTVAENISLGREPRTRSGLLDRARMTGTAAELIEMLGLRRSADDRLRDLSVAEQQLVEIARALTSEPCLLAMDEPSATLTEQELEHLFAVIDDLRRRGVGIVYISHRLEEIARICDRVTVLRDGRWIGTDDVQRYDRAQIVRDMVGRELSEEFPGRSVDLGEEILRLDGLTRAGRYRDVSLSLHRGEILGLAGLVGSGRSDLAMGLVGSPAPDAGQVFVRGRAVRVRGPRHALELGIGLLTEDRKQLGIIPMRSVLENMSLSASVAVGRRLGILDRTGERTRAEELQRALGVRAADLGQPIVSLSGGNQQKALLGRVLATGAEVFVFDEPTRGIDVAAKAEIYGLLNELVRTGKAVLMISSELPELIGMCDRIAVMHEGLLRGILDRSDFDPERVMELATGGAEVPP